MEILFWLLSVSILFIYGGYGIILAIFTRKKKSGTTTISEEFHPSVTLVIAAYNEEEYIQSKLENSLNLDYPKDKLKVLVVSDGSTDLTPSIVENYHGVESLYQPERKGKIHAIARAMKKVQSDITVFTDANCMLNSLAIKNIVKHFNDPTIGAVAGEKRIMVQTDSRSNAHGEGLYWKIESKLKEMDFRFHSVVGAAGELFAIRSDLYEPVKADTILDDFMITLNINIKGYRTAYAPDAYATELASSESKEEFERKVRISAGGFQAVPRILKKLNPINQPRLAFLFFTHRASRWYFAPFALIGILIINLILANTGHPIYTITMVLQFIFYLMAGMGHLFRHRNSPFRGFLVPYYFTFMHLAVVKGLWNYLRNNQDVKWKRVQREKPNQLIKDQVVSRA